MKIYMCVCVRELLNCINFILLFILCALVWYKLKEGIDTFDLFRIWIELVLFGCKFDG